MITYQAPKDSFPIVKQFYNDVIDEVRYDEFRPMWEKGVYPDDEMLRTAIERGEMCVTYEDGELIACMIVNQSCNEGYRQVHWSVDAADDELLVIHALGVRKAHTGRGVARTLARFVILEAQRRGMKTVRLDVLEGNTPADRAYAAVGFRYVETVSMYYEDTGWMNFRAYEYVV